MKNILTAIFALVLFSCQKLLDEKPDSKLAIPAKIEDMQAVLDFPSVMNQRQPGVGEGSADDYYLNSAEWASMQDEGNRNVYIWGPELFFGNNNNDWVRLYETVYRANMALEQVEKFEINAANKAAWENVKGSALFYRSNAFLTAVQIWAQAYDESTAASDPGIPLRLSTDFNIPSTRASVKAVYDQIITDVKASVQMLPDVPAHVMRPSKAAAYALLARTWLVMRNYPKAKVYADSALQVHPVLIDFRTLNASATYPFHRFNGEVIFHTSIPTPQYLSPNFARIDSALYQDYTVNDLRRTLFYRSNANGTFAFRGSFDGSSALFTGTTTAEMLLIRAECYARMGDKDAALTDLNALLEKRWKSGTFVPYDAATAGEALALIVKERRKELVMRDRRWIDIKRFNKEEATISITRVIDGQEYRLSPNNQRFALPLPEAVISLTGMQQNPR